MQTDGIFIGTTYQTLIFERIVDTSKQEPKRPKKLKPEFQNKICQ